MNRPLRHVLTLLLGCFTILFVQLNRIQVFQADEIKENPANTRTIQREFDQPRATITTADGVVVAVSEPATSGPFEHQRRYPEGELYAHTVGYVSFTIGAEGIERGYADAITGRTPSQQLSDLTDLIDGQNDVGTVVLSLDDRLQRTARDALGDRVGSVVAMDPRDGSVLALWSYPSFDPNPLASNDSNDVNAAYSELLEADGNPLRAAAYREIFFPGSTFKIVTAAAALDNDVATLTEPVWPTVTEYTPPLTTRPIRNFGGSSCGGDLAAILARSCNAAFSQMAAEDLGPTRMVSAAEGFGFNADVPFDVPGGAASVFPTDYGAEVEAPTPDVPAGVYENTPKLAQTAIGQNDVAATPLLMAMMVAAVAGDGSVPTPHAVAEIQRSDGSTMSRVQPGPWRQATDAASAADLRQALIGVVEGGTAASAAVPGLVVGAKTGTAQLGTDPPRSHAWIVGFAGRTEDEPEIVVAVLVESQVGSDQTGGRVAGPIAQQMFEAYFADPDGDEN
ncbi:MAG: peptidoglycan D,D-transpeptidase FtsI family protein [Acidimicrobiales bacterium]